MTRDVARVESIHGHSDDPGEIRNVFNEFSSPQAPLITLSSDAEGREIAEITHEALFDHWRTLNGWLNSSRDDIRFHRRLEEAARHWNDEGRPEGLLWRSPDPDRLGEYYGDVGASFSAEEKEFSDESNRIARAQFHKIRLVRQIRNGLCWALVLVLMAGVFGYIVYRPSRASHLVSQLLTADIDEVERLIRQLGPYRRWANRQLQESVRKEEASRLTLNARLALLPVDSTQADNLYEYLLDSRLEEFCVICRALAQYESDLLPRLWDLLHDSAEPRMRRFRAGLALAQYSPDDEKWSEDDWQFLADQLLIAHIDEQLAVRNLLSGVSLKLIPPLKLRFRDEAVQPFVAAALMDLAPDRGEIVAKLACGARPGLYELLLAELRSFKSQDRDTVYQTLYSVCEQQPDHEMSEEDRRDLGKRRADSAITLIRLSRPKDAFAAFDVGDDPESVTEFVERCWDRGIDRGQLLACLDLAANNDDLSARFAILLALGYTAAPSELKTDAEANLISSYASDPSAAIHSATGWLLRKWRLDEEAARVDTTPLPWDPMSDREWFVDNHGGMPMTFVVLPAGRFIMGSEDGEEGRDNRGGETFVEREITRPFAMLDREINVREWKLFDQGRYRYNELMSPSDDHPVNSPDWYMAVAFCRWLTRLAGLPESEQCYADPSTIPEEELESLKYGRKLPRNWPFFPERSGYRLPTEAEWEYACRAEMRTAFGFGNDRSLLAKYAWCKENSVGEPHPVRQLRPNFRGLFDMHGNAWEWCHDWYAETLDDGIVDSTGPDSGEYRVLRGGAWRSDARSCRSADRSTAEPGYRNALVGFRIVRTLGDSPSP